MTDTRTNQQIHEDVQSFYADKAEKENQIIDSFLAAYKAGDAATAEKIYMDNLDLGTRMERAVSEAGLA